MTLHISATQVINVAFFIERGKSDKFCSEDLILATDYFTCRKSTTRDQLFYFPSEGSYIQYFYAIKNPSTAARFEPSSFESSGEHDNYWTTEVHNTEFDTILSMRMKSSSMLYRVNKKYVTMPVNLLL